MIQYSCCSGGLPGKALGLNLGSLGSDHRAAVVIRRMSIVHGTGSHGSLVEKNSSKCAFGCNESFPDTDLVSKVIMLRCFRLKGLRV